MRTGRHLGPANAGCRRGRLGRGESITGIDSISCAAAGDCGAIGTYTAQPQYPGQEAFVVSETNGIWGRAQSVPGLTAMNVGKSVSAPTISCAAPGDCAAVGGYANQTSTEGATPFAAFVVNQVNGVWDKGFTYNKTWDSPAFVVDEKNGVWASPQTVPGMATLSTHQASAPPRANIRPAKAGQGPACPSWSIKVVRANPS